MRLKIDWCDGESKILEFASEVNKGLLNGTVVSASLKRSQFEWQSEYSYAMTESKKKSLCLAAAPDYPMMCYVSIRVY
jgi:hypothetical protein